MNKILSLLLILNLVTGCTTHLTDLSLISNKNINLENVDIDKLPQKKNIEGKDSKFVFLFIPFGQPKIKEALNDALQKGDGDMMINASLYITQWWFIFGETGIKIKGDVVNTKGGNQ